MYQSFDMTLFILSDWELCHVSTDEPTIQKMSFVDKIVLRCSGARVS